MADFTVAFCRSNAEIAFSYAAWEAPNGASLVYCGRLPRFTSGRMYELIDSIQTLIFYVKLSNVI
ncbi:MAG: hypothetical protein AAB478_01740 [Patescibacteria group bacterium]